jgi:hypothetical protein
MPDRNDAHLPPVGEGTVEELRTAVGASPRMVPTSRQARRWTTITERENRALELTAAGATYEQIGKILSITRRNAQLLVDKAVARRALEINRQEAGQVRAILMDRLVALHRRWWPMALGNPAEGVEPSQVAADMILKIHDRLARITGVDSGVETVARVDVVITEQDRANRLAGILDGLAEVAARQRAIEGEFREDAA